jgi:hypothetical protein
MAIGASKLDKYDAQEIRRLTTLGYNDCEIARQYIPRKGQKISRMTVRDIRIGKRWNDETKSFVMKEDIKDLPVIETTVNGVVLRTELGWLQTRSLEKWFFLTYKDNQEVDGPPVSLMLKKPGKKQIMDFHNFFVQEYL